MEIKQATLTEFVEVLFLMRECVKDMNSKGLKQWNNSSPSPEQLREELEKGTIFLYQELGIVKGLMKLTSELPSEYAGIDWKSGMEKPLFIKLFAIHPLWHNSNISEKLIEFAEFYAKENNYSGIRLDTLDNYTVGVDFFENKQFVVAGTFQSSFQKTPFVCYEKSL
jgi:GNAT superfamily N-acetyltransferase